MARWSPRRMILASVLGALLLAPWAAAAEPRAAAEPGRQPSVAAVPLHFMTRFWILVDRLLAKSGCSIDPNGCPTGQGSASEPPAQVDSGCLDPNGVCASGK